jgi:hypothetical protein
MRTTALLLVLTACSSTPTAASQLPVSHPQSNRVDACSSFDERMCSTQPGCHPEFGWPYECRGERCVPTSFGFTGCHAGATVICTKPTTNCDEPDPPCEREGAYRVQWIGICHEGCVPVKNCAPG